MSVPAGFTGQLPTNPTVTQYIGRTIAATESLPPSLGGGAPTQRQAPVQPPPAPPTQLVATATAGMPGTIVPPAATAGAFDNGNITADPLTPWDPGEYVSTTSGADRYWDGNDWQVGRAP